MAKYAKAILAAVINIIALIIVIVLDETPDRIPTIIQAINGLLTAAGVYTVTNRA